MGRNQYSAIELLPFGIVLLIALVGSNCPNKQTCDCTSEYINCTCHRRESIIFDHIDAEEDVFSGKEFVVNGCGKIILKKLSLKDFDVESVYLSDLQELRIESFAFYEGYITNILISNVEEFILETQGFSDIKNITNLTIKNVTLRKLDKSIFSSTTVPHFIIKDSNIETAESQSLQMDNWESITIENNTFKSIEVGALRIENLNRFSFIRNSVEYIQGNSFTLTSIKEVDIGYCRFRQIATSMIITKQVELFSFHNNYIRTCEEKAFWGVKLVKQLNFVDNRIVMAKTDSLVPNYGPNDQNYTIITNENNEIGCDCGIEWLLSPDSEKYNSIKEKSVCHLPQHLKGLSLTLLKIYKDKDGNCSSVDIVTTTEVPATTIPTTTETEEKLITDQSLITSTEEKIDQSADSIGKQPTNEQQVSCKDKLNSKDNSGNKCLCNTILPFAFVVILISIFRI